MPAQSASWTCSACALAWVLRSTGADSSATEARMIQEIGYPENINPTYGLMNGNGIELRKVLLEYGLESTQSWLNYAQVFAQSRVATGLMSGGSWYHWVSIRGIDGPDLWIANSAPGYKGVYDVLTQEDFERLGPFSVVTVTKRT